MDGERGQAGWTESGFLGAMRSLDFTRTDPYRVVVKTLLLADVTEWGERRGGSSFWKQKLKTYRAMVASIFSMARPGLAGYTIDTSRGLYSCTRFPVWGSRVTEYVPVGKY